MLYRSSLAAFSILALISVQPAFAQGWLQRYLSEHKNTDSNGTQYQDQAAATGTTATSEPVQPEVRRALPADNAAAPASSPPVARALPADGSAPPPVAPELPRNAPAATPILVRRALPVDQDKAPSPAAPPETVQASPKPTPSPLRAQPAATPATAAAATSLVVVPTRTPVPVVAPSPVPVVPPPVPSVATAASPSPAVTGSAEALDPDNTIIRLTPGAAPVAPDVNQFRVANDLYTAKQFERAAPEFERYLSMFQNGTDREAATFRLAESYRQTGSLNSARRNYETVIFSFDDGAFTGPAAYRLADICFDAKEWQDALIFYRKASVRVKDPALALAAKVSAAHCMDNLKNVEEAIDAYTDILATRENNPFREESQLALARLNADAGRKAQAIPYLNALRNETQKEALQAEATVRIGLLWIDLHQLDKAAAELTKALKMPELGEWKEVARIELFRVLDNQGSFKAVLEAYATGDKQFSPAAMPEVLCIVADSNRQLGKYADAIALYDEVIHDYPDTVHAGKARSERLFALHYTAPPLEVVQQVDAYLTAYPDAGENRDQLTLLKAESYRQIGRFADAAPLYAALSSSGLSAPRKADAQFKAGWCYAQIREYAKAITAFSDFLAAFPANDLAPTALAQRAFSNQQLNKFPAALDDYDMVLKRYPHSKEREFALWQKAKIEGQRGETETMVAAFTLLLTEFPKSPAAGEANYWIGSTAMQNKKYREAVAPLETARKLDKEFADRATVKLLTAHKELEERDAEAKEVDRALEEKGGKTKVPAAILRWLGELPKEGDSKRAEKYLTLLTGRNNGEDAVSDDWLDLGRARNRLGRWLEAESALKVYLKDASDPVPEATGNLELGIAQLGAGELDAAQKSADKVLEKQPEGTLNSKGRMLEGDIAMARGDFESAVKEFLSVSLLCAEDPELTPKSLEKAYKAYKAGGKETEARKVLNELQSKYPEYQLSPATASRQ